MFGTKHSTKDSQSFYNYYNDVSKKIKQKKALDNLGEEENLSSEKNG